MVKYPLSNILVTGREMNNLSSLQTYLEITGSSFYQSNCSFNIQKTDFAYFLGDSTILLKRFEKKADIRICSVSEKRLSDLKKNIENILSGISDDIISS